MTERNNNTFYRAVEGPDMRNLPSPNDEVVVTELELVEEQRSDNPMHDPRVEASVKANEDVMSRKTN